MAVDSEGLVFKTVDDSTEDTGSTFEPHVLRIEGHESLGSLYEFVVYFSHPVPLTDADLDKLLSKSCQFNLSDGGDPLFGIVREVELTSHVESRAPEYRDAYLADKKATIEKGMVTIYNKATAFIAK